MRENDTWDFINKSKYRIYISSVQQSNRNSIEFSLSTWTRSGSKALQSKFLQVPNHVTLDRGAKFVSKFFWLLAQALNIKLHFLVGYYLEVDGQTEHTNQTLKQYL